MDSEQKPRHPVETYNLLIPGRYYTRNYAKYRGAPKQNSMIDHQVDDIASPRETLFICIICLVLIW